MPLYTSAKDNNSAYKQILSGQARINTSAVSGTTYYFIPNVENGVGPNLATGTTQILFPLLNLTASEYAVTGLTTKLNLQAVVGTANTAPARTYTIGLYPQTIAASVITAGTVVAGSTVAIASPGANSFIGGLSGDFSLPSDGPFAFGVTINTNTPAGSVIVSAALRIRNV